MKARVYLETTIVSYLASRPSRDLVLAAHQQVTRDWWELRRNDFALHVSQYVIDESSLGDDEVAARRLSYLRGIPLLETRPSVIELAESLVREGVVPRRAAVDALHVAIAAANAMDVLLTWNCAHLANAERIPYMERFIRGCGFAPPVICTPEELMGEDR